MRRRDAAAFVSGSCSASATVVVVVASTVASCIMVLIYVYSAEQLLFILRFVLILSVRFSASIVAMDGTEKQADSTLYCSTCM
jgi:hypothetical protein